MKIEGKYTGKALIMHKVRKALDIKEIQRMK